MPNPIEKTAKWMERVGGKMGMGGHSKGFIADMFVAGVMLFVLFIAMPILSSVGTMTTQQVIQNNPSLNATQIKSLNTLSTNWFLNAPDIMGITFYFILVLVTFVAAGYEGANPAVALIVGVIFLIIAEIVSFGLADIAHAYISQANYTNIAKHYGLTTYVMNYLPYFNGVLTIAYLVFVIIRREDVVVEAFSGGGGGGGSVVDT